MKVGILGYGNLGRGVESAIRQNDDMELTCIITRRDPKSITPATEGVKVYSVDEIEDLKDQIDVLVLCGGSATDLPKQTPEYAKYFNVIDSFDTHAKIPEYFKKVDEAAVSSENTSVISGGWDPGMFSVMRLYANAILPEGNTYTFWGKGVSQGHSDAIRRIPEVKNAKQYTIPIKEAMDKVRNGENPEFTTAEKHLRECFVVAEDGADKKAIEEQIKNMPNYFADYITTVHFITEEQLERDHSKMAHGGFVIHSGETGEGNKQIIEYSLKLDSNPEFTSSVLITLARAAVRMNAAGQFGAKSIFDIPPALMSAKTPEELRKELL